MSGIYDIMYVLNRTGINDPSPSSLFVDVVQFYDPILAILASNKTSLFGLNLVIPYPLDADHADKLTLSQPVSSPLVLEPGYDQRHYANTLHGIADFVSILSAGQPQGSPDHSKEHFCRHATFEGSAVFPSQGISEAPIVQEGIAYHNDNGPVISPDTRGTGDSLYDFFYDPSQYWWDGGSWMSYRASILSIYKNFQSLGKFYYGGGTEYWRLSSEVLSISKTRSKLSFRAATSIYFGGYYPYPEVTYTYTYELTLKFPRVFDSKWAVPYGDSVYFLLPEEFVHLRFEDLTCSLPYDLTTFKASDLIQPRLAFRGYRGTGKPVQIPSPDMDSYNDNPFYTALYSFKAAVDRDWHHVTPSALFSVVSAIQSIEHGTSTDVLQTVAKLPEYKSMVPKIKEAIKILSDISRKDLKASTIKEILDLAAGTILQSSFQWRPLLQLLQTELPKMVSSLSSMHDTSKLVVGRGSWNFEFPESSFGRVHSHLMTRSKIVLDVSNRSLAASLFGADAIGVLPKPSNLWDLVPYSFVLNWFTGIGQSMKRAEYAILLMTIPAYYVHTYAITTPLTTEELALWSVSTSSIDPLSMKVFYRDVSLYTPFPMDSKFGFGIPTSLPPIGTIGALLYQMLF
jgi:hypothetical protein